MKRYLSGLDLKDFTSYSVCLLGKKKLFLNGKGCFIAKDINLQNAVGKSKITFHISRHRISLRGFVLFCFFLSEPGYVATPIAMVQAALSLLEDSASLPKQ